MKNILVVGGGPAGAAAAISAVLEGSRVRLADQSTSVRHKVCGEFISPAALGIFEKLRLSQNFAALEPAAIRRCVLYLGRRVKRWRLPECAWGLSRLRLDSMLLESARELGVTVSLGERVDYRAADRREDCTIVACGRTQKPTRRDRLFGFKAHFDGPSDDAVELFFGRSEYIGVNPVEQGVTNVCGIAPESVLRRHGFDFDEVALCHPVLAGRLRPLRRRMSWLVTGPLTFVPACELGANMYPAGDSLSFVDPFTGSGILNALLTGWVAGLAAARKVSAPDYAKTCRSLLDRAFFVSSTLRGLLPYAGMNWLAAIVPGRALFRLTRAHIGTGSGRDALFSRLA